MATESFVKPELFEFLVELKANNNREWFNRNKKRYEKEVRGPLLRFIEDFSVPLRTISPHFVASPKKVGGSLFRIYRDVRFSADKSPYKTAVGIQFRHEAGKNAHCPGYYLHLEPSNVFVAMGLWQPDNPTLLKLRSAIAGQAGEWKSAKGAEPFCTEFTLGGESLKRAPKGFDPEHPLIEDLKRKDFVAFKNLEQEETYSADFFNRFVELCRLGNPFMEFLTRSIGVPW